MTQDTEDTGGQVPASAPDPFDPASFRLTSTTEAEFGVKQKLVKIPVRKPGKQEFFRCHPTLQMAAAVIEFREDRQAFLVSPLIAASLPGETKLCILTLCVTRQHTVFLWPVPAPHDRETDWAVTAREAAATAQDQWVRLVPNMHAGMYDISVSERCDAEPAWPDITLSDLLRLAFGEKNLVLDHQHPALARLRGE